MNTKLIHRSIAFPAILFALLFILLIVSPNGVARAQTPVPPTDDEVNAIAHQLFCPICENTPLDVCPTQACRDWRELIRQMLSEGKSEAQIKQYFVENYGVRVLGTPPAKGINWLAYVVPPVVFLAGVFLLFQAFRKWKQMSRASDLEKSAGSGTHPGPHPSNADDKYVARLEDELKKRN